VYSFAEVKYKQLVPLAPSVEHGLGGFSADQLGSEDEGLTIEAIVSLSEEALVLYVKALTLLAKAMDIASLWWSRKQKGDTMANALAATTSQAGLRINSAVQWVRGRFNEVLEKTEVVRRKLLEAQKQLPEDHPSHPNNQGIDSTASTDSGTKHVFVSPGVRAERLLYDRALEMSRSAAIDEIANDNLPGCEMQYITSIRMLEAVLENDGESVKRRISLSGREGSREEVTNDLEMDDQQYVNGCKHTETATGTIANFCSDSHNHGQTRCCSEKDAHDCRGTGAPRICRPEAKRRGRAAQLHFPRFFVGMKMEFSN